MPTSDASVLRTNGCSQFGKCSMGGLDSVDFNVLKACFALVVHSILLASMFLVLSVSGAAIAA